MRQVVDITKETGGITNLRKFLEGNMNPRIGK